MKPSIFLSILVALSACASIQNVEKNKWTILKKTGLSEAEVIIEYSVDSSCTPSYKIVSSNLDGVFDKDAHVLFKKHFLEEIENYFWEEEKAAGLEKLIITQIPEFKRAVLWSKNHRPLTQEEYLLSLEIQRIESERLKELGHLYRNTIVLQNTSYKKLRCLVRPGGIVESYSMFEETSSAWIVNPSIKLEELGNMSAKITFAYELDNDEI